MNNDVSGTQIATALHLFSGYKIQMWVVLNVCQDYPHLPKNNSLKTKGGD